RATATCAATSPFMHPVSARRRSACSSSAAAPAASRSRSRREGIRGSALPLRFHAVISPYYAFNHLEGRLRRAQAVAAIARHLAPGGTAIIHAASPEALRETPEIEGPGTVIKAAAT